jgi:hypothetical protein
LLPALDLAHCLRSAIQTSEDQLQAMLIAMFQVKGAALVVRCLAGEKADDQVRDGREEREVAVVEIDLPRTADQRRPKRSWMRKWRITGVRRRTVLLKLQLLPRLRMIST